MICTCRDPMALGVVHRADAPCYYPEPKHEPEPVKCMCGICKLGKREWQGLTDEEIDAMPWAKDGDVMLLEALRDFARVAEAKLKAKNGFPQTEKNT